MGSGLATNYFDADNLVHTLDKIYNENFSQSDMKIIARYKELKESGNIIIDENAKEEQNIPKESARGAIYTTASINGILLQRELSKASRLLRGSKESGEEPSITETETSKTIKTSEGSATISPYADKNITRIPKWLNDKLESSGINDATANMAEMNY